MRILVTGGTGLVGKAVQEYQTTEDEWVFVNSKNGDLRDNAQARALFERVKPDCVLHLAARVGGLFANSADNVGFFDDNMDININVLRLCKKMGVKKVISCLSTCVFPDKTTYPIDETMLHNGPPHPSNVGYSYAKRLVDVMNHIYGNASMVASAKGTKFTSVIPTNIYGEWDNFDIEGGHVIPGLIQKCFNAKASGTDFVVYGSGKPLRQFIYAGDLGRLLVWAVKNYDDVEPLILSVDEADEVSIGMVAAIIADAMEFNGKMVFDTTKADGQFKKTANNTKLRGLIPDFEFTNIREGIKKTVDWFLRQQKLNDAGGSLGAYAIDA
jgi:GDP-L-fucose synthase